MQQRVGGRRPPTKAAVAWWRYVKRCVLQDWREKHGKIDIVEVTRRAREDYPDRFVVAEHNPEGAFVVHDLGADSVWLLSGCDDAAAMTWQIRSGTWTFRSRGRY